MQIKANTVAEYLAQLPADRREALEAVLKVIRKNIDKKFEEGLQYGMPAFYLPHSVYPNGYHCDPKQPLPFASVASQKNHIALYLFCVYMDEATREWFASEWKKSGKKLDMGKACFRVKSLEDIPLDLVGQLFKRLKAKDFVATYESMLSAPRPQAKAGARKATKKQASKKKAAKKTAMKKVVNKKAATTKQVAQKKVGKKKASKK